MKAAAMLPAAWREEFGRKGMKVTIGKANEGLTVGTLTVRPKLGTSFQGKQEIWGGS